MTDGEDFTPAIAKLVKRLRECTIRGWNVGISWGADAGTLSVLPSVTHEPSGTIYQKMYRFDSRQMADAIRVGELPNAEVDAMIFGMIEAIGQFERWREPNKNDPIFKTLTSYTMIEPPATPTVVESSP